MFISKTNGQMSLKFDSGGDYKNVLRDFNFGVYQSGKTHILLEFQIHLYHISQKQFIINYYTA